MTRFAVLLVTMLLALSFATILGVGLIHTANAAPSLLQQASGGGTGTSFTITFSSPVSKGDLIVVSESEGFPSGCFCNALPPAVTDTQLNTFTEVTDISSGTPPSEASIWFAAASASGTDTITITLTGCAAIKPPVTSCGNDGAVAYELSGFTSAGAVSSALNGSSGCCSVNSITPEPGSFVVAAVGVQGYLPPWSPGAGYNLSANDSPLKVAQSEYLVGWEGCATNAPISGVTDVEAVLVWDEAVAAFAPSSVCSSSASNSCSTSTSTGTGSSSSSVILLDTELA